MKTETNDTSIISVPDPTLKRLPKYIHLLQKLKKENVKYVSSSLIADELELDSIQVRKDLAVGGVIGKPKVGFELDELLAALYHTLNWDNISDAFLIGAGSLGSAILGYDNFKSYGLNIIAAFDNSPVKIGKQINGIKIFPEKKLKDMIKRMHINIAILTVPPEYAQQTADTAIEAGIRAIWNFAPVHLKTPADVVVENAQLSHSLGVLTHKLAENLKLYKK